MPKMRSLADVTPQELLSASRDLCRALNIPGSIVGRYNIYEALLRERERATGAATS